MFQRIKSFFTKSAPNNYFSFNDKSPYRRNWWQLGYSKQPAQQFGPVYACIQIFAQEIAKLPIHHYRIKPDGSRERIFNSAAARLWREPNRYQSRSDFWLYEITALLTDGNAYALAERNNRNEITGLYPIPPGQAWPHIEPRTKDVFYRIGDNATDLILPGDGAKAIPARNMLHLRTFCPRSPLVGESPITAAEASAVLGQAIEANGANFFLNMSRPSGVLRVPGKLGKEARDRLKTNWQESLKQENQGKIGVLSDGAEWQQLTMSAQDADIVLQHKMTIEDVARVFRIPLFMLGDMEKTAITSVESLRSLFYSGALSFYLEHIEAALNILFNVGNNEFIQFDFEQTLRTNFKERLEALSIGTKGGIYKIDEARAKEYLPKVEGGDNVFIQQQMQTVKDRAENKPLDTGGEPDPEPNPDEDDDELTEDEQKSIKLLIEKAITNEINK